MKNGEKISIGLKVTVNLGDYESVQLSAEREVSFDELTDEDRKLQEKQIFLSCVETLIKEGNYFFKKFNRSAVNGFPKAGD